MTYAYTDGLRTTLTADVPTGGTDQTTTYTYGTTKGASAGDSKIGTGHLLQIHHRNRQGQTLVTELAGHKPVKGVLVPHRLTAVIGTKRQVVTFNTVEINPLLTRAEIVGAAPKRP